MSKPIYLEYGHCPKCDEPCQKVTDFLMTTDNPFYWLMVVLCTRGMNADEIIAALREQAETV